MRFSSKDDKKLQSNLRTLLFCSQYKTIELSNFLLKKLSQPENQDLVDFLTKMYIENEDKNPDSIQDLINIDLIDILTKKYMEHEITSPNSTQDLINKEIPKEFQKRVKPLIVLNEHKQLRSILYGNSQNDSIPYKKINLESLRGFLRSKEHTDVFKNFGNQMLTDNKAVTLLKYKSAAKKLANDEKILNREFEYKIDEATRTFSSNSVLRSFNKEFKGRLIPTALKTTALAVTLALSTGGVAHFIDLIKGHDPVEPGGSSGTTTSSQPSQDSETSKIDESSEESKDDTFVPVDKDPEFTPPLSKSKNITSYKTATEALFKNIEEMYKYNTGDDIDLSDLDQRNINSAKANVLVVNYNDKEYIISTMSEISENHEYIKRIFDEAHIPYTVQNATIAFLTRDDKSIAISTNDGIPVQSTAELLKHYGSGTVMPNQTWVNTAKKMMKEEGIDSNRSDSECIVYYLLNREPEPNQELSRALGPFAPVINYAENTFGHGNEGYTSAMFGNQLNEIVDEINQSALYEQTGTPEQAETVEEQHRLDYLDYDEREI